MPRRQEAQDSRSRKLSSHILSTHRREGKEGRETEKRGGRRKRGEGEEGRGIRL